MSDFNGPVLVLGATDETGKLVVKSLQAKHIPVRLLVRDEGKASEFQSPGIEIIVGDPLNSHDEECALTGVKDALQGFGTIARADVAEVLVQALLQPEARNRSFDIINDPEQGPANREGLFR